MDIVETNIVGPGVDHPNRSDGTCYFCSSPSGQPHSGNCIVMSKTVVVKVELEVVIEAPRHWGKDDIEFDRNLGTWCSDNLLRDLGRWSDMEDDERQCCSCDTMSVTFVREATLTDHASLPYLVDLPSDGDEPGEDQ